jgi:hypothetical protein
VSIPAGRAIPEPTIIEGDFVPTREVPFSSALDELIAAIRKGDAPNLGRFCGYCCTPLRKRDETCPTCSTSEREAAPREKISRSLAEIYTRKRKREGRWVHGAAWSGLILGTLISVLLIMTLPGWTKILAVVFMIVGSYFIATYMANVLVQNRAYRSGLEFFARGWSVYLHAREQGSLEDD